MYVNLFVCMQGSLLLDTPPAEELVCAQRTVSRLVAKLKCVTGDDGDR